MGRLNFVKGPFIGNGEPYINFYDVLDNLDQLKALAPTVAKAANKASVDTDKPFTKREVAAIEVGMETTIELFQAFLKDAKVSVGY